MFRYFIVYSAPGIVGNAEIHRERMIDSIADLREITKALEAENPDLPEGNVVITNVQKFPL